jgi:hypothetical protein
MIFKDDFDKHNKVDISWSFTKVKMKVIQNYIPSNFEFVKKKIINI